MGPNTNNLSVTLRGQHLAAVIGRQTDCASGAISWHWPQPVQDLMALEWNPRVQQRSIAVR